MTGRILTVGLFFRSDILTIITQNKSGIFCSDAVFFFLQEVKYTIRLIYKERSPGQPLTLGSFSVLPH